MFDRLIEAAQTAGVGQAGPFREFCTLRTTRPSIRLFTHFVLNGVVGEPVCRKDILAVAGNPFFPFLVAKVGFVTPTSGGTETLLLAYLIRTHPEFGRVFRDLLESAERRIALAIFKVPRDLPYPYLSYDLGELRARIVLGHPVK